MTYRAGDALGVIAENPPHIVDEMIELQGWDPEHPVTTHAGERTLRDALKKDYEVHMASSNFVSDLLERVKPSGLRVSLSFVQRERSGPEPDTPAASKPREDPRSRVETINASKESIADYLWTRDYVDIMREFDLKYSPEEFLALAGKVKPRLYSCLLYTSPSPRDRTRSRMPSSA